MENIREILFFLFAFVMMGASFGVILHKNPVKSALFLVVFFVSLASLYGVLGAEFLAVLQVLVYVGAIMVLFLFVIMLIAVRDENFENIGANKGKTMVVFLLVLAFTMQFAALASVLSSDDKINTKTEYSKTIDSAQNLTIEGNAEVLSFHLFEKYILPFELISIVLLIGVIGAVVIAKKNRRRLE
ncbi:MAG: NADH-quinone oxidoreductase subunit J [Spirochaetia bacterium]|nr:NADH-quinone oxidoreductase subunit J [Spirochaetia bacterium]